MLGICLFTVTSRLSVFFGELSQLICPFENMIIFYDWVEGILHILWMLVPYQAYDLQMVWALGGGSAVSRP